MDARGSVMESETMDGIIFGMQLATNPKIAAARKAYFQRRAAFSEANKHKTRDEMIAELKAHNPAYLVDLLRRQDEASVRDRYVTTFMPRSATDQTKGE